MTFKDSGSYSSPFFFPVRIFIKKNIDIAFNAFMIWILILQGEQLGTLISLQFCLCEHLISLQLVESVHFISY